LDADTLPKTAALEKIALEAAMFRSLMANVADNCHVHDGPLHSDGYVWRHKGEQIEQASEFDYMILANTLVRVAELNRGNDPQGRLKMFEGPVAEILAEIEA
jgi:hypothetical protein